MVRFFLLWGRIAFKFQRTLKSYIYLHQIYIRIRTKKKLKKRHQFFPRSAETWYGCKKVLLGIWGQVSRTKGAVKAFLNPHPLTPWVFPTRALHYLGVRTLDMNL